MDIHLRDERTNTWETPPQQNVYWVALYTGTDSTAPRGVETFEVTGADLWQVIEWTAAQALPNRIWSIALVEHRPDGLGGAGVERGLRWLIGLDANDDVSGDPELAEIRRGMFERKGKNVIAM